MREKIDPDIFSALERLSKFKWYWERGPHILTEEAIERVKDTELAPYDPPLFSFFHLA